MTDREVKSRPKCFLCDEVDQGGIRCGEEDEASHYYCKSCFQNYIYSRVEYLKKDRIDIPCADPNCQNMFSRRRIRDTNLLTCEQFEYYLCRIMSIESEATATSPRRSVTSEERLHEQNLQSLLQLRCSNEACRCLVLLDNDFKDCFKLTCDACKHNLCGWCFRDLGDKNDYYHIANCPDSDNFGQVYARHKPYETFYRKQHIRMARDVINYLHYSIPNDLALRKAMKTWLGQSEQVRAMGEGIFPPDFWSKELTNDSFKEYEAYYEQLKLLRQPLPNNTPVQEAQRLPERQGERGGGGGALGGGGAQGGVPSSLFRMILRYLRFTLWSIEFLYVTGVDVLEHLDALPQYRTVLYFTLALPFLPHFLALRWRLYYLYKLITTLIHYRRVVMRCFSSFVAVLFSFYMLYYLFFYLARTFPTTVIVCALGGVGLFVWKPEIFQLVTSSNQWYVVKWALTMFVSYVTLWSNVSSYVTALYDQNLSASSSMARKVVVASSYAGSTGITARYPKEFLIMMLTLQSFLLLRRLICYDHSGCVEFLQLSFFLPFVLPMIVDALAVKPVLSSLLPWYIALPATLIGVFVLSKVNIYQLIWEVLRQTIFPAYRD